MSAEGIDDSIEIALHDYAEELSELVKQKVADADKDDLDPITPADAVDKYFEVRDLNRSSTVKTQRSSLGFFVRWCDDEGIDNLNDLTGRDLADYRIWRREDAPVKVDELGPKTEQDQQQITRKFVETCETFDACPSGLHHKVIVPKVDSEDEISDEYLESDRAEAILQHLHKYEYASVEHVTFLLFARTGARVGGLRALDVDDYYDKASPAYLDFVHRLDEGTPLKNGRNGERNVSIRDHTSEVLNDYIENNRPDVEDEYGRRPLLASQHGRLSENSIRKYCYKWTRPCAVKGTCPYNRDPETCEATNNDKAYECPGSLSCHPVRKGYITQNLRAGLPKFLLAERCNVDEDVIDKHYDHRTEQEKMEARNRMMEALPGLQDGYVR